MGSSGILSTRASSKMVSMHLARSDSLSIAGWRGVQSVSACWSRRSGCGIWLT